MKKLALIYNPNSGDRSFKSSLDEVIKVLQSANDIVYVHRSESPESMRRFVHGLRGEDVDTVVACGGDGSLNLVINAMMEAGVLAKFGIIPSGTANDFAAYLELPKDPLAAAEIIADGNTRLIDLGKVNDKYFINVFAVGYPADVSNIANGEIKNIMGKLAYYMKGAQELQSFTPINVDVTNSEGAFREELSFALVLNGRGAGGFLDLVPDGSASDGKLDFLALRKCTFAALPPLLVKIMRGELLEDENILHFRDSFIQIQSFGTPTTNIDGEEGPPMSVTIKNIPKAIEIYVR
jgi:YegS/Rv2252/BmrU family lipid kinase